MTHTLAIFGIPGGWEWLIIGGFALLLFGSRLPQVARSMGKSIVEFKRGLQDVKEEMDTAGKALPEKDGKNADKPPSESPE